MSVTVEPRMAHDSTHTDNADTDHLQQAMDRNAQCCICVPTAALALAAPSHQVLALAAFGETGTSLTNLVMLARAALFFSALKSMRTLLGTRICTGFMLRLCV